MKRQFRTTVGEIRDRHTDVLGKTDAAGLLADLSPRERYVRETSELWKTLGKRIDRQDIDDDARQADESPRDHFCRTSRNLWQRQGVAK